MSKPYFKKHFLRPASSPLRSDSAVTTTFIEPQLAKLVSEPASGSDWIHELKYDGYRIQVHANKGQVKLFTRNGHDWSDRFPSLVKAVEKLPKKKFIIDGEAVVLDSEGRSNFQKLQNALDQGGGEALRFFAFDLLQLNEENISDYPLIERKNLLRDLLKDSGGIILYSEHFPTSGKKFLESCCALGLEGIISKKANGLYSSGRGPSWVKAKCSQRQEFVVGGFTDPEGMRSGFGSLLLGVYEGGKLKFAGKVGTGFNQASIQSLVTKLKKLKRKSSPFEIATPKGAQNHWVSPKLVAEVVFANWTEDSLLRAPVFMGLRADKSAREIIRERVQLGKFPS